MSIQLESRQAWLVERSRVPGVGASEAAALFNLHPNISAFSLFEKLVNPQPPTDEEIEEESDFMAFGLAIEPYLAEWYQRKTGRRVSRPRDAVSRLAGRPHIFASLDREYETDEPEAVTGDLELKSAIYFKDGEPLPDYWQVQAQQQMLCRGFGLASFAILGGFRRRYLVNDIPANAAFQEILVETIDRFMNAVQAGSWDAWGGEIEGSKATREALRRLYPRDNGTAVRLPAEASTAMVDVPGMPKRLQLGWADRRDHLKKAIKFLETLESEFDNKIKAAIGENSYGVLDDGSAFSLKVTKGSTHTVTKEDYRTLRRVKALPKGILA